MFTETTVFIDDLKIDIIYIIIEIIHMCVVFQSHDQKETIW